jgi:hypothetical protein
MEQSIVKVFAEASPTHTVATVASGNGSALFVINLCASMAPLVGAAKTLAGLDKYRVYQVSRVEDGRTRYRLRVGFFASEDAAQQALAKVREQYPTAFTTCLADEDRRFARGFVPEHSAAVVAPPTPVSRPSISMVVDNDSTRPVKILRPETAAAPETNAAKVDTSLAANTPTPAPKAVAATPTPIAAAPAQTPATAVTESAEIEIDWEALARALPEEQAQAAQTAAPMEEAVEVELSWESPAAISVKADPPTHAQVAKIEAKTAAAASIVPAARVRAVENNAGPASAAVTTNASTAKPAPAAPSKSATANTGGAPAAKSERTPAKQASSAALPATSTAAPAAALELVTSSSPLPSSAAPIHRGVVDAKAPSLESIRLQLATELAVAPTPSSTPSKPAPANEPFHVGKGVELPATDLSLDTTGAAPPSNPPGAVASQPFHVGKGINLPAMDLTLDAGAGAPSDARARAVPLASSPSYDNLDSTQTIRALTEEELNDESQEKCFAIQLAVSEQPVNLDAIPHLDIFEAYRLYSIATVGSGKITHSLRIGFFREEVSADAVAGYLRTFFPSPSIVRISLAEQARFKDPPQPKPVAEAAAVPMDASKVVALSDARARAAQPTIPTITMEVATPKHIASGATGSFNPSATGTFKPNATGAFKANATGTHKLVKTAAKVSTPPSRHSAPLPSNKKSATGKHPALSKKPLAREATDAQLSASDILKPSKPGSLLSRLVGKLSK